jgi:valyl-tRNA synthetase
MLYQYFPEFRGLKQKDFKELWHQVVNGQENKNAQNLLNQDRQLRLIQLKTLNNIADKIREAYRQYHEDGSGDMLDYNFTLRESSDCAMELSQLNLPSTDMEAETQVRKVVKEIFIPKLDEPEEKKNIEALIGAI